MSQPKNKVVPFGVENCPHERPSVIPRDRSTFFYHPLWAVGVLLAMVFLGGVTAYYFGYY